MMPRLRKFSEGIMSIYSIETGKRIRIFRKKRKMTIEELASRIYKSKSTVSKYENGEIAVDIDTLYQIADILNVHIEQFLYTDHISDTLLSSGNRPSFFSGIHRFYSYVYDGRNSKLIRCVFDELSELAPGKNKILMYMNYFDPDCYQRCETTYYGYIEHYDAVTNIMLTNKDNSMEKARAHILASYLDSEEKWGLWTGLSSRPMMPIATKMLFRRTPAKEDKEFIQNLLISREDIRLFKLYNMYPVL